MKLYELNKDTIPLTLAGLIVFVFFISGMFDVLDYFIIKILLILSFVALFILAIHYAKKNEVKKNRPEDLPQDDSH